MTQHTQADTVPEHGPALPTADEVVRSALVTACAVLREQCSHSQRQTLKLLLSNTAMDRMGEHQLRQAYSLMHRMVTTHRVAAEAGATVPAPVTYTLELTWPRPPLSRNGGRGNPIARSRTVKTVRTAGWALAKQQKIPQHDHIVVRLHYAPGRRQAQDPMNWTDTTKALIDGLRDAGVIADDDTRPRHRTGARDPVPARARPALLADHHPGVTMGRHSEPTRLLDPADVQAGDVVLVRITTITRWLLLDHVDPDVPAWQGRFLFRRSGHGPHPYDGTAAPGDDWHQRAVMRGGRCVVKGPEDARRDRERLNRLTEQEE